MDDDELLARTPSDPEAFGAFYRRHEAAVLAYFVRRVGNPERAADLTAETFATALVAARRYRPGGQPAGAWLFGIARHKLWRSLERERVERRACSRLGLPSIELSEEQVTSIERLGDENQTSVLLEHLPADQAAAVQGRIIDELPYADLAARLRCSEIAVRQRVSRGLRALRAIVRETT